MTIIKQFTLVFLSLFISSCLDAKTNKKSETLVQNEAIQKQPSDFIEQKVSDNIYILKSPDYNTNIGVFIGDKEILLIDPMTGSNHQALLSKIQELSLKPIKYVVNTHSHGDHSGANSFFADRGATIISQENAKYSRAKFDVTFKDHYTIEMENEKIRLFHLASHTFDDALIHFEKNNVIFMGDTFMTNSFPHFYYGGGSAGHIAIIEKALSLGKENTAIIPAHGNLTSTKEELNVYRKNSIAWISRITALSNSGKTAAEIIEDEQIKKLSLIFNGESGTSRQRFLQTIEKTISADLIPTIDIDTEDLKKYTGKFDYKNGETCELVLLDEQLIFRSQGAYIYEIIPVSESKFHLRGQTPHKSLTFNSEKSEFIYFNGKEHLTARRPL